MYDVITIGSATRDVFLMSKAIHPHRTHDVIAHIEACFPFGAKINVDEIHFATGGGATNNAVTFARLGKLRTAAITRVGNDGAGREIIEDLKKNRVDAHLVQKTDDEFTAYSTILSPGGEIGERTILVYRGASKKIDHASIPWSSLKAKWIYSSSLGGDHALLKKLIDHASNTHAQLAFNPGGQELRQAKKFKSLFQKTAFLILNREEAARLTGASDGNTKHLFRSLLHFAPRIIMTDGPKGAYGVVGQKSKVKSQKFGAYYVPSVGHKPKNLTGAGDAFGSGFITGWIKSKEHIEEALRVAAINADSVVQHIGAKVGILDHYPTQEALRRVVVKTISL